MNCKKCGHELHGELYCPECGEKVFSENPNDKYKVQAKPVSNSKMIMGIVGLSLSLIALIFFVFPYVGLIIAVAALVLSIIGIGAWRMKGFGIAGTIVSVFALLFSLLFTFLFTSVLSRNKKNSAEKKASTVLSAAKLCILEERYGTVTGCVDVYGSTYTTTVTQLMAAGELESNPFENYGADGGMTIVFNEDEYRYTVTCSGTIDGYTLTYNGYSFSSKKA